jgi:hypothetical protein
VNGAPRLIDLASTLCDNIIFGPALLFAYGAELTACDTRGLVNGTHEGLVFSVVLYGELGIPKLCDNGGLTGHRKSRILSAGWRQPQREAASGGAMGSWRIAATEDSGLAVASEAEGHAVPQP